MSVVPGFRHPCIINIIVPCIRDIKYKEYVQHLRVAYAITVHKAQGLTLPRIELDITGKDFSFIQRKATKWLFGTVKPTPSRHTPVS
jgi:hypothetical protein